MKTNQRKSRRTPAEVRGVLERFSRSGSTQAGFARAEGMCVATLQRYLRRRGMASRGFVEVNLADDLPGPRASGEAREPFRVNFQSGVSLEVPQGFCPRELGAIVGLLRARP